LTTPYFKFQTYEEAKKAIDDFIKFYNKIRIHGGIKYYTPEEYYEKFMIGKLEPGEIRL